MSKKTPYIITLKAIDKIHLSVHFRNIELNIPNKTSETKAVVLYRKVHI